MRCMAALRIRTALWSLPIVIILLAASPSPPVGAASAGNGVSEHQAATPAGKAATEGQAAPRRTSSAAGSLVQLPGKRGCAGARSARRSGCATARAMKGAGPFLGSRAVALSPDGRNAYVASYRSDAVAVFVRNKRTGTLAQAKGKAGCVAANAAQGCGAAVGLDGPNSVAVSDDGRYVYVTSRNSDSLTVFRRKRGKGALRQLEAPSGCFAGAALSGCSAANALEGPDVVVISKDGKNVYVGSFFGDAVAIFNRDARNGKLTQPGGTAGCIAAATDGCVVGLALDAPEGLGISSDGNTVYVASAVSNAVVVLDRDQSGGGLTQASDGGGCIIDAPLTGCSTGRQLAGANAIALSPNDESVYVTSLLSNSVTAFNRSSNGDLAQKSGIAGCMVNLRLAKCSLGRKMAAPEGVVVAPDGRSVYVAAFGSGAIDVLDRNRKTGAIKQKSGRAGCIGAQSALGCTRGRAMKGVSSIAVSPDSRHVYSTSFGSSAINIFRRIR
jgi:DNA-binding beta-propeller fold protein YncE